MCAPAASLGSSTPSAYELENLAGVILWSDEPLYLDYVRERGPLFCATTDCLSRVRYLDDGRARFVPRPPVCRQPLFRGMRPAAGIPRRTRQRPGLTPCCEPPTVRRAESSRSSPFSSRPHQRFAWINFLRRPRVHVFPDMWSRPQNDHSIYLRVFEPNSAVYSANAQKHAHEVFVKR